MGWGGGGGFQVTTESNPTKLLLELLWVELSYVELRWVLTTKSFIMFFVISDCVVYL